MTDFKIVDAIQEGEPFIPYLDETAASSARIAAIAAA